MPVLPAALKDVNKPIENIVSAIEQGIIIPATKQRLDDLEEQRKALETNILQEQIAKPLLTREQILFWFERFRQGNLSDPAYQRNIIDCFVNSVYIFDDRFVVNFNYRDGDKLVSLQEVKSSSLAEYGLPFEPSFSDGSFFDGKRQYRFFTPYSQDFTQNAPGIDCSACFFMLGYTTMDKKDGPFFTNRPRQGGMYMPFSEENVLDFVKWLEKVVFLVERALGRIEKLLAPEFMMVGTGRRRSA